MATELKPCPLCEGKAYVNNMVRESWRGRSGVYVSCQRKSCRLTGRIYSTRAEAVAAWNTRPADADALRRIEREKETK